MSERKETTLSNIIEIIGGGTPKTSVPEYWDGNIPWLSVVDFNTGKKFVKSTIKHITELGLLNSSTKILRKGDIIISARGTVGAMAVLGKDMAFNQSCYGIRAIPEKSDTDFVYYLIKDSIDNLQQISHGGVFDTITRDTFDSIGVYLPSLPEQKAIAGVLSSLDDKIDLLHRQNKTLEAMAETLFRQWFIEEAEDDWEVGCLPDEFNFTMGQSPLGKTLNENKKGIPMFQGNADFGFRFPLNRVFTTAPTRYAEKYDTLISVRAPVGAQNMASEKCCIGRGVAAFRYRANPSYYTYTYYKMKSLIDEIKIFNDEGTVFGSIGKKDFQSMMISIPPPKKIKVFESVCQPLNDKIIENCHQMSKLENMRNILLPKFMDGEVSIKGID
ncbi:MAG: restriction endonuclease subunit S [Sphaerochaetaceae bacterium]|jgi:type I restriction enzyme S subunit|nr:restriction endonuclease subunit S [Sphaerochaetaceae bacterium]